MPEGDSVYKAAARMRPHLVGHALNRVALGGVWVPGLAGRLVEGIETVGKHLVIWLAGRDTAGIHVHLGLSGRWRPGPARLGPAPWRGGADHRLGRAEGGRRQDVVTVAVETAAGAWRCLDAPLAELRSAAAIHSHLDGLGPDLMCDAQTWADRRPLALDRAADRSARAPQATIKDLLLNQGVAAGLGNVYASEVPWVLGVDPRTPLARASSDLVGALLDEGRRLLWANRATPRRTTTFGPAGGVEPPPHGPRYWAYGRTGGACLRCGGPIAMERTGRDGRRTWWCTACQAFPPPVDTPPPGK